MPRLMLPQLNLEHLKRMTDCTGIIQHAAYAVPELATGYTTDDNARALIVALKSYEKTGQEEALKLAERYLAFLAYAGNPKGKFRNFADYTRRFVEEEGSDDSCGRAVWACGYTVGVHADLPLARNASRLLERTHEWIPLLRAPRARAFSLLGLHHLVDTETDHRRTFSLLRGLADSLLRQYRSASGRGWFWFEDVITYSNGIMPMALMSAYRAIGRREYLTAATESLAFLTDCLFEEGVLCLVGNQGWYPRGGKKARLDEQPEDAGLMVMTYLEAYRATGRKDYLRLAEDSFAWFLGRNSHGEVVYDNRTGGCHDGITRTGLNLNQGAESLLAYLLSHLALTDTKTVRSNEEVEKGAAVGGT